MRWADDIPDRHWDLIINGLSSGWDGSFPDLAINEISAATAAYDLIYSDQIHRSWLGPVQKG